MVTVIWVLESTSAYLGCHLGDKRPLFCSNSFSSVEVLHAVYHPCAIRRLKYLLWPQSFSSTSRSLALLLNASYALPRRLCLSLSMWLTPVILHHASRNQSLPSCYKTWRQLSKFFYGISQPQWRSFWVTTAISPPRNLLSDFNPNGMISCTRLAGLTLHLQRPVA